MLPYWVLFGIFALGAIAHRRESGSLVSTPLFALAALLMMAMIGLRFEIGPDWQAYLIIFERLGQKFLAALEYGDPGFYSLIWLVKALGLDFWALNLVCAAIFTLGLAAFAKRQQNPWLAIAVAVPYLVIVIAMSAMRQATAIGFILMGLAAFADKSLYRFLFWIFFASLFHASALIMLPIVGLSYTRNRFQSVLLLCVVALPAYYLLAANFEVYIERYTAKNMASEGTAYRIAMNALPAVIFLFLKHKFAAEPHQKTLWTNFALGAVACIFVAIAFPESTALDRVVLYVIPLQIYVFGNLPAALSTNQKDHLVLVLAIILYLAMILMVYLSFSLHRRFYIPYQLYPLS